MLNNDAMYDGRQTVYNKKKMLNFATFLHALQTLQQDKLKRPQIMLTFFALSFPKLLFIRFAFPSPKKSIVCDNFKSSQLWSPVTDHSKLSLTRAIPLYDLPETLLKHQL